MLVLVDASRGAPRLHAGYGSAAIFLHNDRQPVWQNPFVRRARRERDDRRGFSRSSLEIDHHE